VLGLRYKQRQEKEEVMSAGNRVEDAMDRNEDRRLDPVPFETRMAETDAERLERVLVIAEYSESWDAILLATEVRRLRKIETALIDARNWKRTQEAVLKATAKEDRMINQVESAYENEREARLLGASAEELERILEGKGIA
jgi:hypothetical protein